MDFEAIFLFITHIYIILFFGVDPTYAAKIMYCHLFGMEIGLILVLLYKSPRPFWKSSDIGKFFLIKNFFLFFLN